ncbi:MAG: HAMP domain-containing protein, partial [Gammaproteobacteria bacterium]|nr:HAMP domain-containing protein [Gammaproteobacteria bacterium]
AEGRLDEKALKDTFSAYMDINPSIEIYLLDLEGRILSFSADPGRVKRQRVDLGPIRAFLRGEGFPLLGDDPRSHDRRKAFSVTPVPSGEAPEGYLYVVLQGEQYESAEQVIQESYVLRLSAWAVAGSLGFGLLAGLLLFHLLTRRLQRLSVVMGTFQDSGFTQHVPYAYGNKTVDDEVGRLGDSFDRMAERMITQFGELKDQDQLRRELVAQVSHDLRTPLAALHGYLETLRIKGGQLDTAGQNEYLDIALRQSSRLTRMVEDLFELANLEARDASPKSEPCAIAELLQDVVQKFRLPAEEARVELKMEPPATAPLVVAATLA